MKDYINELFKQWVYEMAKKLDNEIMNMINKYAYVNKDLVNEYSEECKEDIIWIN